MKFKVGDWVVNEGPFGVEGRLCLVTKVCPRSVLVVRDYYGHGLAAHGRYLRMDHAVPVLPEGELL